MTAKMGDLISAAHENLPKDSSDFSALVKKTKITTRAKQPAGYRAHVERPPETRAKKRVEQERRSAQITMRLTATERLRFISWCEDQNVSMSDGLMLLLEAAEANKPAAS